MQVAAAVVLARLKASLLAGYNTCSVHFKSLMFKFPPKPLKFFSAIIYLALFATAVIFNRFTKPAAILQQTYIRNRGKSKIKNLPK